MISFLKLIAFISDGLYDRVTSNSHQIVKKVFSSLALIFLVFVALFFTSFKLLAACSPYTGYATINEAGRVGYVEIKLLDSRIDPAIYQSWTVSVCEGQRNRCSGDLPLTGLTPTNTSFILVYTDLIPSNRPFDIILKDADGNTIDYFSVDYTPQQDTSCSLPFPWSSNVENTHVYLRYPDGTGIWSIPGKGNSGVKTGGAANTPWLPDLSVVNITVAKGDPATFVFTIPAAETVDITFDYSTVDNTALAGTHYTAASGTVTIPAGSTSGSVSIATTAGSPDGTVVFDMFLSNPVNANIISNYISATLINAGPSAIKILHDGSGINCLAEAVTVRLLNNTGGLFTGFTGAINLSTSTGNGDWSLLTGSGVLTTGAADSGSATYTFNLTDGGEVVFQLSDTHQESVNIAVTDGNIFDDDTEGLLTFRPFGFVFSPDPISTQIAGRPFNLTLTAAGQTPAQPECGVIEEYTGLQSLNFWGSYVSPATSPTAIQVDGINVAASQAGSAAQNVNFTNGVGNVSVLYNDVGQISLSAQDQFNIGEPVAGTTDEIIGGITPFVVRPFGYDIQINTNPYANDGNDPVFASAGQAFNMTIRSVLWQAADDLNNDGIPDPFIDTNNDAVPDSGGNLSDNGATPNISQIAGSITLTPTALVVANSNGLLASSNVPFASFGAGTGIANISQSWNEAGILQIDALTGSFMASGQSVTGQRINIGRFIPSHYLLTIDPITEQCGTFTYGGFADGVNPTLDRQGQLFTMSGTITAQNTANVTTQNYAGVFAKLGSGNLALSPFNSDTAANDTGSVAFSSPLNFVSGVSAFSDVTSHYLFDTAKAPFNLQVNLSATDSDGVTSALVSSNAFEVRLGRLTLLDSYGPEIADLEMRLMAEYYEGSSWKLNTSDLCSSYMDTNVSFDGTTYTDNLNAGETSVIQPTTSQSLISGKSALGNGLWFSAPGENNYGSVRVIFDVTGSPWLQFDRDGDNVLDAPTGLLSFGYYRGSDRMIYWREVRN